MASRLRTPADVNRFLISLFALRIGPLRRIPEWLQASAEGCVDSYPAIAVDLFETAKLERSHKRVLLEDLVGVLRAMPGIDFRAMIRGPFDPRVVHHLRLRNLVPIGLVPAIVLAIDLELALLDRDGGAVLLDACQRAGIGCDFLRLRQRSAERRIHVRMNQLRTVLQPEDDVANSWATIASDVLLSYVDVLDGCAGRIHSTSPAIEAQPIWQPSRRAKPATVMPEADWLTRPDYVY
jgi:hypothetical protein